MPPPKSPVLEHEKLNVYHRSLDLSFLVAACTPAWPVGKHSILDQLLRASTSVVLNIAEGAGEYSPREKARFYRMARRSATECSATLDVSVRHGCVTDDARSAARTVIVEIVAMLTALCGRLAPDAPDAGTPRQRMTLPLRQAVVDTIGKPAVRPAARPEKPFFPEPFGEQTA